MPKDLLTQLSIGARGLRAGRMTRDERWALASQIEIGIDWIARIEEENKRRNLEADLAYANGYRDGRDEREMEEEVA